MYFAGAVAGGLSITPSPQGLGLRSSCFLGNGAGVRAPPAGRPAPTPHYSPWTDARLLGPCWISMINTAMVTGSVASPALVSQAF